MDLKHLGRRVGLFVCLVPLAACSGREQPRAPAQAETASHEPPTEAPPPEAPPKDGDLRGASAHGPALLWIFPKLSARLEGEIAEPLSQPVTLLMGDGRPVHLAVLVDEGEVVPGPAGQGAVQRVTLDVIERNGEGHEPTSVHRFSLRLAEGPDETPTDDLLRAEITPSGDLALSLLRRGLREDADELASAPSVQEIAILAREANGSWQLTRRER